MVSDFLINPVLRQARRFSRSTPTGHADAAGSRPDPELHDGTAVEDIVEGLGSLPRLGAEGNAENGMIAGATFTSSPIDEHGGLETELQAAADGRSPSAPAPTRRYRMSSLTSDNGQVDNDVSGNPSFGIPNRFRTNSAIIASINGVGTPTNGASRRSTLERSGSGTHHRTTSLPADDGMGALRQQIIHIQEMDVPPGQKARLMHELLTRGYARTQEIYQTKENPVSQEGMISQERPITPNSLSSFLWQMNGSLDPAAIDQQHTFHLSPEDLRPTYAPPDEPDVDEEGDTNVQEEAEPILGCKHYRRNVKLQCSSCDKWYTCRLCHDAVEDHVLNRKATKNMLCMICGYAQRAGEFCVGCGERTAWFYCNVCKLWDNDSNKSIYHCNDCGICRKGRGLGKDFFHCKVSANVLRCSVRNTKPLQTCGTCMSMSVEKSHKCIERVSDCDCPICGEYMFTSPSPVVFMLCGHSIHKACYDEHMKTSYKCPICSKSTVNMETQFRNLDRAIDQQPMPPQFQDTKAMVSCNDCYAKSAVKYHWLGLKCAICDSYNTAQLSILSDPAVEIPPLESRESENIAPQDQASDQNLATLGPGAGAGHTGSSAVRIRRHSTHIHLPSIPADSTNRFSPYTRPSRIGRSVSPVRGLGFFDGPAVPSPIETDDETADEDELDFWGGDERRSATSAEVEVVDDEEMEDDSDEDSDMNDCEEEGDDEEGDEFELFGHR